MDETTILESLVATYSPSGTERRAVRAFTIAARALGYAARTDRAGNGVATRGLGRPELLYLGHIDTVEGDRGVRRARGRVAGRGAVDAKGGLACALWAGRAFEGPGTYRVVAAVGEETDSRGARHLISRTRAPDFLIAGEPSGWDGVTIGYRGELKVEATFRQPRRHDAAPGDLVSDVAIAWLAAVREALDRPDPVSPFRSLTVRTTGFEAPPGVDPRIARLTVDLRLPPGRTVEEVWRCFPRTPGAPNLRKLVSIDPVEFEAGGPVVRALVKGIRAEGGRPTLWRKTGTSDMNLAVDAWSVPAAAYAPGDAALDHTDRESVAVADLQRSSRVLSVAIDQLLRARSGTPGG